MEDNIKMDLKYVCEGVYRIYVMWLRTYTSGGLLWQQ
jgi:hypothetical protein